MSDDPPPQSPTADSDPTEASGRSESADDTAQTDGVTTASEDGTPSDYTTSRRTLDPRIRWLWVGRALFLALFLGAIPTVVTVVAFEQYVWVGPTLFVLVGVLGITHSLFLYRSWEYHVREDSMFLDRGVLTNVQTVVPYVRVQHIDTSRGPLERLVGLSTLVVYTAGSRGADVTVPGLTPEEATDLQKRLKALAIESEGEDAV